MAKTESKSLEKKVEKSTSTNIGNQQKRIDSSQTASKGNVDSIDAVRQLLFGNQVDHFNNELVRLNKNIQTEIKRIEDKIQNFNHTIVKKIEDVYKKDVEERFKQFDNSNNERFKGLTFVIDKINSIQDENYKKHSELIEKNKVQATNEIKATGRELTKIIDKKSNDLEKDKVKKEELSKAFISLSKAILS